MVFMNEYLDCPEKMLIFLKKNSIESFSFFKLLKKNLNLFGVFAKMRK